MARVTVKKGLDSVNVEADTVGEAIETPMAQALGIPDNPEFMIEGIEVDSCRCVEDGDIISIQQKASQKA